MRAVHRDENDKVATPFGCKQRISQRFIGDSSIHTVGMPRVISAISTVIADLIRNPEVKGGAATRQNNRQNPLSLDGDLCKTQWNSDNMSRFLVSQVGFSLWIPAYAGMTVSFAKVSLMGEDLR